MNGSSLIVLILISTIILISYLILSLNSIIITFDWLFNEVDLQLGFILLIFFLLGSLITIFLEVIYFLGKRRNKNE